MLRYVFERKRTGTIRGFFVADSPREAWEQMAKDWPDLDAEPFEDWTWKAGPIPPDDLECCRFIAMDGGESGNMDLWEK